MDCSAVITPMFTSTVPSMRISFIVWHFICTFSLLPFFIATLVMGSLYINSCKSYPLIPSTLIILGVIGIVEEIWRFSGRCRICHAFFACVSPILYGIWITIQAIKPGNSDDLTPCDETIYTYHMVTIFVISMTYLITISLLLMDKFVCRPSEYTELE